MSERPDTASLFYGDDAPVLSRYRPAIDDSLGLVSDVAGWTEQERTAHTLSLSHAFNDAKLSAGEASIVASNIAQYSKAAPDEETVRGWEIESRRALREQYGTAEGDRRLALAAEFVANRPELRELLNQTGVGSHPKVVRMIAEKAGAAYSQYTLRVQPTQRRR